MLPIQPFFVALSVVLQWLVRCVVAATIAFCTMASSASGEGQAPAQTFVVRHARVFDGTKVLASTDVFVRDGLIAAVGHDLVVPAGVAVVDGTGRTLMPGLIDAHVHTYGSARRDAIRFGVTTELDMFTDWHLIAQAKIDREHVAPVTQSDLWSAGTLATAPRGHGTEYGMDIPTLTRPDEADAFVAARFAEGSDYLKIILEDGSAYGGPLPTLDAPTTVALVAAAHRRGKLAVAHAVDEAEAMTAVDARIDGLVHVFIDRIGTDEAIARIRRSNTFVVPTLSVAAAIGNVDFDGRLADDPQLKDWLSSGQTDSLRARFGSGDKRAPLFANAVENVRRLHAAGVPILAGTDAGNPGTAHGPSLHGELELLVRAGLTPIEALVAATSLPATTFRIADRGRIARGQRADLVLVAGDPTRDITATRAIVSVWKNGALVDRSLTEAERTGTTQAPAATDPVISDFEDGALTARFGQPWTATTDKFAGGLSTAELSWIPSGADGSKGAMRVTGEVKPAAYPWAGALFMPGATPFAAVDFSERSAIVFKVRGDARPMSVMVFAGSETNRLPVTASFDAAAAWTEVRIPLARFEGADFRRLRGLAFTVGAPAGPFTFELDDIRIE